MYASIYANFNELKGKRTFAVFHHTYFMPFVSEFMRVYVCVYYDCQIILFQLKILIESLV